MGLKFTPVNEAVFLIFVGVTPLHFTFPHTLNQAFRSALFFLLNSTSFHFISIRSAPLCSVLLRSAPLS